MLSRSTVDSLAHYLQIILLGIVEGVTEFLPISSTGHLLIAEGLGLGHEPDVFNVVIQAGAILAVVFIYWRKIVSLLLNLGNPESRNYLLKIAFAFVVTSVISLVLIKKLKIHLPETLTPVAWATLVGGLIIFAVEFLAKKLYAHEDVSWTEAGLIGAAQVVAGIFPGTSRSGATIMTALATGMKRTTATEFSFLLGIPTMFAASALDIFRYRHDLTGGGHHQLIIDTAIGFFVSLVVAFFVVKWLLRFVQSHTFNGFAIYRVLLGIVLLAALATHAIPDVGKDKTEAVPATPIQAEPMPTLAPATLPTTNTDSTSTPTNAVASPADAPTAGTVDTNAATPPAIAPDASAPATPAPTPDASVSAVPATAAPATNAAPSN